MATPPTPPYVLQPLGEGSSFGVRLVMGGRQHPAPRRHMGLRRFGPRRRLRPRPRNYGRCAWGSGAGRHRNQFRPPLLRLRGEIRKRRRRFTYCPRHYPKALMPKRSILRLPLTRPSGAADYPRARLSIRRHSRRRGPLSDGGQHPARPNAGLVGTPKLRRIAGIDFGDLVEWLVDDAGCSR